MDDSTERIIESAVPPQSSGQRLDVYLSSRFSYMSRTAWQKEIGSGRVLVNGAAVLAAGRKVRSGDLVAYRAPDYTEPEIDPSFEIIYEDDFFTAVSKSGNLPVHPSGVFFRNTLVMLMESEYGAKFYPVHRLDRETSGAILFGRSAGAASLIQRDFRNFSRSYLTVVCGVPERSEFTVDVPIGPARCSLIRKKREAYEGAPEEARTDFRVVSSAAGFSLLEAFPVTGRMHQIRVHLRYAGLPIAGDKLYGEDETVYLDYVNSGPARSVIERAGFSRCALHSRTIEFIHPYTSAEIFIEAPLPADMRELISCRGLLLP